MYNLAPTNDRSKIRHLVGEGRHVAWVPHPESDSLQRPYGWESAVNHNGQFTQIIPKPDNDSVNVTCSISSVTSFHTRIYQEWCDCERKNWSNGLFTFTNAESDPDYIPVIGSYDWNLNPAPCSVQISHLISSPNRNQFPNLAM